MRHLPSLALALVTLMMAQATAGARPAARSKKKVAPRSAPAAAPGTSAAPSPAAATPANAAPAPDPAAVMAADDPPAAPSAAAAAAAAAAEAESEARAKARSRDKDRDRDNAPAAAPTSSADLEKLRADYDRLRDDLFRARSRAQVVEDALWTSKLSASFRWKGAPSYVVHHATVKLDGGEIWDSGEKAVTDDLVTVAERAVKPGPHAVTLRLEIRPGKKSKDSDRLGYVSEHTFAIIVPEGQRTRVAMTGDEDGDAPEYEPEIEVELERVK